MKDVRLVFLSGPSGAGKSTAVKALEDLGYFCVDNIPVALLTKFVELIRSSEEINRVGVVVDVRERGFLKSFARVYEELKEMGFVAELVFLEASDEALARRFSETRRRHPLAESAHPLEGIRRERELLKEVKALADRVIDTTSFNVHQLRDFIKEYYAGPRNRERLSVNVVSFGFRHGIPTDADLVMDVRFLPNPYFVDELKDLDGKTDQVRSFVLEKEETREFLSRFKSLLDYLVPLYMKEGKSYLTIALGCTGGKHRSVAVADELSGALRAEGLPVKERHRDVKKP